jgi:hypothetical protein
MRTVRLLIAAGMTVVAVFAAAPFIRSAGYSGWVLAMVLAVVAPFCVALAAGPAFRPVGMMAALAIPASFFLHDSVLQSDPLYAARASTETHLVCLTTSLMLDVAGVAGCAAVVDRRSPQKARRGFEVVTGQTSAKLPDGLGERQRDA